VCCLRRRKVGGRPGPFDPRMSVSLIELDVDQARSKAKGAKWSVIRRKRVGVRLWMHEGCSIRVN